MLGCRGLLQCSLIVEVYRFRVSWFGVYGHIELSGLVSVSPRLWLIPLHAWPCLGASGFLDDASDGLGAQGFLVQG